MSKSGLILTFFPPVLRPESEKRDIKGSRGEDVFDVKKEGEVFSGLTTKKHFFCESGCWLARSLFLLFTLHGSEDVKIDLCSQRV